MEDYYSPRTAASDCLSTLCKVNRVKYLLTSAILSNICLPAQSSALNLDWHSLTLFPCSFSGAPQDMSASCADLLRECHAGVSAIGHNSPNASDLIFLAAAICCKSALIHSITQLAAASPTEQNARHKFAVHAVLLAVKSIIASDPNAFGTSIHTVIAQHVIPDFQSPFAYLRGRACEVIEPPGCDVHRDHREMISVLQVVGEFIKTGVALDAATAGTAVQQIVHLLTDSELPVRIFATTSLSAVMDDENVKLMLRPHVTSLLGALFTIIQQIISEETMATLATIIKYTILIPAKFCSYFIYFFDNS